MSLTIRDATPHDAGLVLQFIRDLAIYEKLEHEAVASEADLVRDLFSETPRVFCEIAEWDGAPAGFALWFYTYSTFRGRHGIWLEDLFVQPDARGHGLGKALLVAVAQMAVERGCARLEWSVLDWNEPAIGFYRKLGARPMDEWRIMRVDGDALSDFGDQK